MEQLPLELKTKYDNLNPQENDVLEAIKSAGTLGIHPTRLIEISHATQPNARINGIRDFFGCTCKHGSEIPCTAKEHIRNKRLEDGTTKYFYVKDNEYTRAWIFRKAL